jgi:hypothetical protein
MTAGLVFAQSTGQLSPKPSGPESFAGPEKSEISGNLEISHGFISVESGGVVYYVMGLHRFFGFIDGLKAGAAVTLEGYARLQQNAAPERGSRQMREFMRQNQNLRFFRVTKLSIGGKDYDLSPLPGMENFRHRGPAPGFREELWNRPGQFPHRGDPRGRDGRYGQDRRR